MVYNWLQSSFVSLAWPWSGRSLPQGEPVGVLAPGQGSNVVRPPVLSIDILSHGCLAGQLQLASWLTAYLVSKSVTTVVRCIPLPQKRHLMAKFGTTLGRMTCGQMYPHPKIRLWVRLLVMLTCGQMYPPQTSGGQV